MSAHDQLCSVESDLTDAQNALNSATRVLSATGCLTYVVPDLDRMLEELSVVISDVISAIADEADE